MPWYSQIKAFMQIHVELQGQESDSEQPESWIQSGRQETEPPEVSSAVEQNHWYSYRALALNRQALRTQSAVKNMWVVHSFQSPLQPLAKIPQALFRVSFKNQRKKVISLKESWVSLGTLVFQIENVKLDGGFKLLFHFLHL